jgi:hypothetical protein
MERYYTDNAHQRGFYHIAETPVNLGVPDTPKDKSHRNVRIGEHTGIWSGHDWIPAIGERVNVTLNGFGHGTVRSYFWERGFIGVEVTPDKRPKWHIEAHGYQFPTVLVFGTEIKPTASTSI